VGLLLVRALAANNRYGEADRLLTTLDVLPYEGSGEARTLYREVKLMRAVQLIRTRSFKAARATVASAREWPEQLGAGEPYRSDRDERLEDLLMTEIDARARGRPTDPNLWLSLTSEPGPAGTLAARIAGALHARLVPGAS
jgi:hypothetical protein